MTGVYVELEGLQNILGKTECFKNCPFSHACFQQYEEDQEMCKKEVERVGKRLEGLRKGKVSLSTHCQSGLEFRVNTTQGLVRVGIDAGKITQKKG